MLIINAIDIRERCVIKALLHHRELGTAALMAVCTAYPLLRLMLEAPAYASLKRWPSASIPLGIVLSDFNHGDSRLEPHFRFARSFGFEHGLDHLARILRPISYPAASTHHSFLGKGCAVVKGYKALLRSICPRRARRPPPLRGVLLAGGLPERGPSFPVLPQRWLAPRRVRE